MKCDLKDSSELKQSDHVEGLRKCGKKRLHLFNTACQYTSYKYYDQVMSKH